MTRIQLEVDNARSKNDIDRLHAQADSSEMSGNQNLLLEAIKGQSQLTGVKWVDGLNATVRPFLTYWWMLIFTEFKVVMTIAAWKSFTTWEKLGAALWNENDWGVLSMIISFWFVDRVFRKHAAGA